MRSMQLLLAELQELLQLGMMLGTVGTVLLGLRVTKLLVPVLQQVCP